MRRIWPVAVFIGLIDAAILFLFEFVGVDFTYWLWTDLLGTDNHRWRVLPAAWLLGIAFTFTIRLFKGDRLVSPDTDLMAEMNSAPSTVPAIGAVLAIGAMSLIAGASLGPEASLMTVSAAIGAYSARKWKLGNAKSLLILASIGALLVAFIDSLALVLVPLLIFFKGQKQQKQKVKPMPIFVILMTGIVSFLITKVINVAVGETGGQSAVPLAPHFSFRDFLIAIVIGFFAGAAGLCMNWLVKKAWALSKTIELNKKLSNDYFVSLMFSTVLGALYLIGGPTIQFSGSIGSGLLVEQSAGLGVAVLATMFFSKVLATAWSKGTGYRGGLVFPSIYIGIALGLLAGELFAGLAGAGAVIGGISGMMAAAVGSPVIAAVFLFAVLPWKLWPVAVCAVIGTFIFTRLQKSLTTNL